MRAIRKRIPEQKVKLVAARDPEDVYIMAVRLLSYRPRSETELRTRLSRKFSFQSMEPAFHRLRRQGLIDDLAFANFWRDNREAHNPRSIALLRQELRRLGVDRSIIENVLQVIDEDESAYQAALRILPRIDNTDYGVFWKKLSSYLGRRGFPYGTIRDTARRIWQELTNSSDSYVERQDQAE